MAELAAVGVAESIISLVEVGWKVVKRINEFRKAVKEVPKSLETVTTQLPIYLDILKRASKNITSEGFNAETAEVIKPAIDKCEKDIGLLDGVVNKLLPNLKDSTMKKARKAFDGVRKEDEIEKIQESIWKAVQLLASYQIIVLDPLAVDARSVTSAPKKSSLFLVPFERDEKFVGRTRELQEIEAVLDEQKGRMSLVGLGGIGKSQIAIEYCYRYRQAHNDAFIFWVYCSTEERFRQSYKDIARRLDLTGWNDPSQDTMQLVVEWLNAEDSPDWFMVMDNIDDLDLYFARNSATHQPLLEYIPQSKAGRLLLTSRDQKIWNRFNTKHILVREPNPDECVQLLRNKLENESSLEDEDKLVESLDYFPLLITQAGAFLNQTGITIAEYMELWDTDNGKTDIMEEDCGDLRRYATNSQRSNSVVRTWQVTFDFLIAKFPKAAELMSLMAMLDRHAISSTLFAKGLPSKLERVKTVATLENFGFISANPGKTTFAMHRLVQLCTHRWLEHDGSINKWQMRALHTMSDEFPQGWHETRGACEKLLPHAMQVLTYLPNSKSAKLIYSDLMLNVAQFDYSEGRYVEAESKFCKVLETLEETDDWARMAIAKRRLASTLMLIGRYNRAEELFQDYIDICTKVFGSESSTTLSAKYFLGSLYLNQAKLSKAELLLTQVIDTQQQSQSHGDGADLQKPLDSNYLPTLLSQEALAVVYKQQGKLKEAEHLLVYVIDAENQMFGKDCPDVFPAMTQLAYTYLEQGRIQEAEEQFKKTFKVKFDVLGEAHPMTQSGLNDLSTFYAGQGCHKKCEDILRQGMEIQVRLLGASHPHTLQTMHSISIQLQLQGRLQEARKMGEQVLKTRKYVLGHNHPHTLMSLTYLGAIYQRMGLLNEAESIETEFLEHGMKTLGEHDAAVLGSMEGLAAIYRSQGRSVDAQLMGERVVEARKRHLGNKHPATLTSMAGLVRTYKALGYQEHAAKLEKYGAIACDKTSWPYREKFSGHLIASIEHDEDIPELKRMTIEA